MDYTILDTKYGKIALTSTGNDHIYVTTNPGRVAEILPWTIRGRAIPNLSAHLHRWSDGRFHIGEEIHKENAGLLMHYSMYFNGTAAQKRAAYEEINDVVSVWAGSEEGVVALHRAEIESLTQKINDTERRLTETRKAASALELQLADLRLTRRQLSQPMEREREADDLRLEADRAPEPPNRRLWGLAHEAAWDAHIASRRDGDAGADYGYSGHDHPRFDTCPHPDCVLVRTRAAPDGWQDTLKEMRRASALVDAAHDATEYQIRMVALALIARELLRRLPAPREEPTA